MQTFTEYKVKKNKEGVSNDVVELEEKIPDVTKRLYGEWEIDSIVDISTKKPDIMNEATVISADFGGDPDKVKRGSLIYITCYLRKSKNALIHQNQMCVVEARITDIKQNMSFLNTLK